jgi:Tol biopolymer transport system component
MDIYKVRANGGDPIQLTTNPENDFGPALSPDGKEIVFQSHRNGWRNLFLMNADGSNLRPLTTGEVNKVFASWSPDGRRLVYSGFGGPWAAELGQSAAPSPLSVYTRKLAVIERGVTGRWSSPRKIAIGGAGLGKWSPTSAEIAFTEGGRLMVVSADDGRKRVVNTTHRVGLWVDWSSDGSILFAPVKDHGFWSIWAFPLDSRPPRRILGEDNTHHFGREYFATDGRTLYFSAGEWDSDVRAMRLAR